MLRDSDIGNVLEDIKSIMEQNTALNVIKSDILDLTEIVRDERSAIQTKSKQTVHVLDKSSAKLDLDSMHLQQALQEILRPYLKDWLDANLPVIVRELVDVQIQKIINSAK